LSDTANLEIGCKFAGEVSMTALLPNRVEAGRRLAAELAHYRGRPGLAVLALPRGGVPVAFEVARALNAPLDVLLVRKLGLPWQPELAIGAIASGGIRVLDTALIEALGIPDQMIEQVTADEKRTLDRRELLYRAGQPVLNITHGTVIIVDDGIATGSTMRAAVESVRQRQPDRVVVAAPVASLSAYDQLWGDADEVVCLATPEPFRSVGSWYQQFPQVADEEVRRLLAKSGRKVA
jgi:putative phosphoribosyl transferase